MIKSRILSILCLGLVLALGLYWSLPAWAFNYVTSTESGDLQAVQSVKISASLAKKKQDLSEIDANYKSLDFAWQAGEISYLPTSWLRPLQQATANNDTILGDFPLWNRPNIKGMQLLDNPTSKLIYLENLYHHSQDGSLAFNYLWLDREQQEFQSYSEPISATNYEVLSHYIAADKMHILLLLNQYQASQAQAISEIVIDLSTGKKVAHYQRALNEGETLMRIPYIPHYYPKHFVGLISQDEANYYNSLSVISDQDRQTMLGQISEVTSESLEPRRLKLQENSDDSPAFIHFPFRLLAVELALSKQGPKQSLLTLERYDVDIESFEAYSEFADVIDYQVLGRHLFLLQATNSQELELSILELSDLQVLYQTSLTAEADLIWQSARLTIN